VTHSDTGIENPAIWALARSEISKMRAFAKAKGLKNFTVEICSPTLAASFAVRVFGGRAMPGFPSTRQDCTTDWKIIPQERLRKRLLAKFKGEGWNETVVSTGVRLGESIKRDADIGKRREVGDQLWTNAQGELRLSPILTWDEDDVWTYLGLCNAGVIESYSDFEETMDVYRDAGGSSCVVVADMALAGKTKPCSSRFGCWGCTMVQDDSSMRQMIESNPKKYRSMSLLADFRDFLANTQYDWSRRTYVGRTIAKDGTIRIAADGYSPKMLEELLWFALSIQAITPHQIVSHQQLVAIDARWSQYGLHPPFHALRIAQRVADGDYRYPPKGERFTKTPTPDFGRIYVGGEWDDYVTADGFTHYSPEMAKRMFVTGLRSPLLELAGESCGIGLRVLNNGRAVLDLEDDYEVNEEGAIDFINFFGAEMLERYPENFKGDWTMGYHTYLSFGTIAPAKGQSAIVDEILRRTQWRQQHDLHGQRTPEELQARLTVRNEPERAWLVAA
jgi:3'-phosphoadenosine 5'-phosphosulfate sulfotransferase (PAPS reductase)/FAD synthetase